MFHGCWQKRGDLQVRDRSLLMAQQAARTSAYLCRFSQLPNSTKGLGVHMDACSGFASQLRNSKPRVQPFFFFLQAANILANKKQTSLPFPGMVVTHCGCLIFVPDVTYQKKQLSIRKWKALQTDTLSKNVQGHSGPWLTASPNSACSG